MKITAPHWVIAFLVILGTLAPEVAQQFPVLVPYCNTITRLDPVILGLLGVGTASVFSPINVNAAAKTAAVKAASALLMIWVLLVTMLGALVVALTGCHETPQAAVAQVISLTNSVCALAPDSPIGQPYVDVTCTFVEGGEQLVSVIVNANASSDAGAVMAATSTAMKIPVKSVRFYIPATSKDVFLSAYGHVLPTPAASSIPASK